MKQVKIIDVYFSQESVVPVHGVNRQSRLIPEDIILQIKEGTTVREISIRDAWPAPMSKLCRKRQQAIRDTLPERIFLKNEKELAPEALADWKNEALSRYLYLRTHKVKLPSIKGLKRQKKRQGRKARQAAKVAMNQ